MLIAKETAKEISDLYAQYRSLEAYEQCVLDVLAVVCQPIGFDKLNKLLVQIDRVAVFSHKVKMKRMPVEKKTLLVKQGFLLQAKDGIRLNPLLVNKLSQQCVENNTYRPISEALSGLFQFMHGYEWGASVWSTKRYIRECAYFNFEEELNGLLDFNKNPQVIDLNLQSILVDLHFMPFELGSFMRLNDEYQYRCFATAYRLSCQEGTDSSYLVELLEQVHKKNTGNVNLGYLLAEIYLKALKFDELDRVLPAIEGNCYGLQIEASKRFIQGEFEQASELYEKAITAKNKYARRKNQFLDGHFGLLYKLCLLVMAAKNAHYYDVISKQLDADFNSKDHDQNTYSLLRVLSQINLCLTSGDEFIATVQKASGAADYDHLTILVKYLGAVWCGNEISKRDIRELKLSHKYFSSMGMHVFALVIDQLTAATREKGAPSSYALNQSINIVHFPTLVDRKPVWDLALEKLMALNPTSASLDDAKTVASKPVRMIWEMTVEFNQVSFKPREQKQTAKGWTKGRPVSLKRLFKELDSFAYLSDEDRQMCEAIQAYRGWDYYNSTEYELSGLQALRAAVKLDNVYFAGDLSQAVEIKQKEPELLVSQQGDKLLLSMSNLPSSYDEEPTYSIIETGPMEYTFTLFNSAHLRVAEIVGEGGLLIPIEAKSKVLESVAAIAPLLNIHSDIEELDTGLETVTCDQSLVINIQPLADGLEFTCVVMPFGDQGPAFKPMVGNAKLTTEIKGKRVATQRDLAHEEKLLDDLDIHCPAFLSMADNVLAESDTQAALAVLEQLDALTSQTPPPILIKLRWPKGKKIKLTKTLESQHLTLSVAKKNEWFDISGELRVNEDEVIELQKLLELVAAGRGRFVALDDGKMLALSQDLRERLDALNQATDHGKFHPLASELVAEASTGMRMKTIHAWDEQAKLMSEANDICPEVPSTLQAQLRDYQVEGYDWMSRLAHWKAGACLADDMGLGKTLQALTLLVSRAANGPSLVIAPTSVCFNWQQEALKFAPTLNMHRFADYGDSDQRLSLLKALGAFDCVVISYGLLQREVKMLADIHWHTVVADEAQALKNPLAKRTQAACALKADFKVITTGTPIENNLTELWSLFRFITPGLLGNLKRFGDRFAIPMENVEEDKLAARKASLGLKTLIQPFILRRMKNQVLTELPSRTEINVHVQLSDDEQSFYEALRRNAVDNIAKSSEGVNEGEQRIKMLAELVKLRQACCNPKLVVPESKLSSAKLEALNELLDELKQNNHKALIFSQFVGHLKLIRSHLDKRGMTYQYLDGATPQKAREQRVNAFQRGEGDVFLISLKAGGSGLNLTAADYVIHMDPWWNPAVEEQASDRAHRMGQKRPVTIYRLIAKNTIEERIVALHQHKRDLADSLLAGNEQVSKLSVADVLNMLKETF